MRVIIKWKDKYHYWDDYLGGYIDCDSTARLFFYGEAWMF